MAEGTLQESVDLITVREIARRRGAWWVIEGLTSQGPIPGPRPPLPGTLDPPKQVSCGGCRFYHEHLSHIPAGVCHRYPPRNSDPNDMRFQLVSREASCGEHQRA